MIDVDWPKVERILDDTRTAHACVFCGRRIPVDDEARWGLAIRKLSGSTAMVWVHARCFVERLHPSVRIFPERAPRQADGRT